MKATVILIGVIVILSLALPAVSAGGGGEQHLPESDVPTEETLDFGYGTVSTLTGLIPILSYDVPLVEAPVTPQTPAGPTAPTAPEAPAVPDAPNGPHLPGPGSPPDACNAASVCGERPDDDGPAEDDPKTPDASSPEVPAPPKVEKPEPDLPVTPPGKGDLNPAGRGFLAAFLGPVQEVAKNAGEGARHIIHETVFAAGHVATGASGHAERSAAHTLAVVVGLVATVEDLLDGILHDDSGATTTQGGELSPLSAAVQHAGDPSAYLAFGLIAGGIGLIAAALVGLRRLLGVGGAALLSRIPSKDIMKNDTRAQIFDIVKSDPGVSLNEIVDRLGISRNAVAYHLAVFESEKQVVSVKDGKYRRYFINGGKYVNGAKDVVSTIKNDVTLNVIRYILDNPGAMQKEVCSAVGTSPSATNWHINRLEKVGLVEKAKVANTVRYSPGPSFVKYDLGEFGLGSSDPAAIAATS